mmetsp:Transcript_73665/g.239867  ORF Transcript_73665/g.239867 Transcript_73665/m.239867 type:complete len:268 (-) Transcript_73665:652-1455(-)
MHLLNERVHVLHRLGPVSVAFTVFLGLLMSSIVHFGTSVHRVRIRFTRGPEFDQGGSRSPVFSVLQAQDPAKEHLLVGMPQPVDLCRGLDQIQKQHADNHNDKNGQETASDGAKHADGMQPIDLACVLFTFRHLLPELGKVGRDLVLVRAPVREAEEEEVEKNQGCHNQAVIHDARLIRKVQSHVPPQCPPILDVLAIYSQPITLRTPLPSSITDRRTDRQTETISQKTNKPVWFWSHCVGLTETRGVRNSQSTSISHGDVRVPSPI